MLSHKIYVVATKQYIALQKMKFYNLINVLQMEKVGREIAVDWPTYRVSCLTWKILALEIFGTVFEFTLYVINHLLQFT